MKYLGLDLGTRTLGLSISDLTHTIASTYKTIRYEENDYDYLLQELKKIIEQEKIGKLVLGLPKNMNNTIGESAERCLNFKKLLEDNLKIVVEMQDERLTTVEAHKTMNFLGINKYNKKNVVDTISAVYILEKYMNTQKKH